MSRVAISAIMNSEFRYYIDLITVLTQKEFKVRYKNSYLGYLWSVGHPLAFALVFFIAFKVVMKIKIENYTLFLITGLFPWQWFSNSVNSSPMIFLSNASIIKKVNFPRNLLPFTQVLQDMIHFLLAMPVIVLFIFIYHKSPFLSWSYGIPTLLMLQFMLTYGICLIAASINLFFRDLERLIIIFTTLLFYFTPVVYSESMIPERFKIYLVFNPLALLMVSWKNIFLAGSLNPAYLAMIFVYAITALGAGYFIYRKLSWKFAEVL